MTAYHLILAVLAILCLCLCFKLRSLYFGISSIALFTSFVSWCLNANYMTAAHWRTVWLPIECLRFVFAILLSIKVLSESRIHDAERAYIIASGVCIGIAISLAGWLWVPMDWFHAAMTIRQYLSIVIALVVVYFYFTLRWKRPSELTALAGCWCLWLLVSAVGSTTDRAGLFWMFLKWQGNQNAWIAAGVTTASLKCLIASILLGTFKASEAESKSLSPSL